MIGIAIFAGSKQFWFDAITAGENAIFWTNLAVAGGTLALAGITALSVLATRDVLTGEEKRFQQSVAPFLIAKVHRDDDGRFAGLFIANVGRGLARQIHAKVEYFSHPPGYDPNEDLQDTVETLAEQNEKIWRRVCR